MASNVHSVDCGPGETRSVRHTKQEGTIGNVAHLPLVNGQDEASTSPVDAARVETVNDGQSCDLPLCLLLQESLVRSHRVVCHTLSDEV